MQRTGRFISPDTMVPDPANPQSLNRYSYCLNNPLKYVDQSGNYYVSNEGMNDNGDYWYCVYSDAEYTNLIAILTGADFWYSSFANDLDYIYNDTQAYYSQIYTEAAKLSGYNEYNFFGGGSFGIPEEVALAYASANPDSVINNPSPWQNILMMLAGGFAIWGDYQQSKSTGMTIESLLNKACFDKQLAGREFQYNIHGDAQQIIRDLTVNAKYLPSGVYQIKDGTYIGFHTSTTTGVSTIDINNGTDIFKIRVR